MSASHTDVDFTLLHASLLAYFRPPSGNASKYDAYELLYPCTDEEEESKHGFWGELDGAKSLPESHTSYSNRCALRRGANFCYLWCTFSVIILGAFGLCFAVDLALSHYGLGTGMAEWIMYRHQLPPSTSYGMKFCLESPNREAPRPQAWHYMRADTDDRCTTDTIDFIINAKETWKVQPDASLLLREEKPYLDRREQIRAPVTFSEQLDALKLGDDLAEEGQLGKQF